MAEQDGFTPQEAAYFESGGTLTEGLADAAPSSSEPVQQPADSAAAQPDAQAAAAAASQQQQDPAQNQPDQRTVPLAALQEERAERKRLRDEMQQMRQMQDALVNRIMQSQQPQQGAQAPQIPDFATDPVGHLRATNEQLQRQLQEVTGYLHGQSQQQQQFTQQQQAQQQLMQALTADENRFRAQAPDYDSAAQFLQQSRAAEYRALGMTDPMQIQQALNADVAAMVNISQQTGTSVAEAAYNLAKARGYKAAQAAGASAQGSTQAQDDAARLATIAQGQHQAASLTNAGGAAPSPMSIEKLLAMSDADFSKATSGMNWQKLNAELSAR